MQVRGGCLRADFAGLALHAAAEPERQPGGRVRTGTVWTCLASPSIRGTCGASRQ